VTLAAHLNCEVPSTTSCDSPFLNKPSVILLPTMLFCVSCPRKWRKNLQITTPNGCSCTRCSAALKDNCNSVVSNTVELKHYFSHTGRTWSIFNMIPFFWLRFSLWLFKHSVRPRNRDEDFLLLNLLKIAYRIAAASCCMGLILAAFRCCHNSIIKLNITPSVSLPAIRPL
jgi:hypothetical protein